MSAFNLRASFSAAAVAAVCALAHAAPANAIAFTQITSNSGDDFASDFSAAIADAGGGQVRITFSNVAGGSGVIGQVYIDDGAGSLAAVAVDAASNVGTVNFSLGATPPNLPSGNTLSPAFVADFAFGANAPAPTNGVNGGETLALLATLSGGVTYADFEEALAGGDLRLGFHGQSLGDNEDSEAFVNVPPPGNPPVVTVPAPAGIGLFGVGVLALAGWRARQRRG